MRLIYFSPVAWDSYEQRPHYVARHFLANGAEQVVWVDPYQARLPNIGDRHRLFGPGRKRPLWLDRPKGLDVVRVSALPVDPLPGGAALNRRVFWTPRLDRLATAGADGTVIGIGRPTSLALAALGAVPHAWSFYDAMDVFPEFYRGLSRRHARAVERDVAARVTRIFASSQALVARFGSGPAPVTLMRNAYDMALLPPAAAEDARRGVGFLGCMGQWFDWPLTVRIANAIAPLPVTLVGPRPNPGPPRLPANVTWVPECHQADTVTHLATMAVGLIPFIRNRLTEGVDPIKYYQYRGAGLTVISTTFGEMGTRTDADDTFFVDRAAPISDVLARALARRPDPAQVPAFRAANSWDARFREARLCSPT